MSHIIDITKKIETLLKTNCPEIANYIQYSMGTVLSTARDTFSSSRGIILNFPYIAIIPARINAVRVQKKPDQRNTVRHFEINFLIEICDELGRTREGENAVIGLWDMEEQIRDILAEYQDSRKDVAYNEKGNLIANISGIAFQGSDLIVTQDLQEKRLSLLHSRYSLTSIH